MLARYLLSALSEGVAAADDEVALAALGKIDWVLRGRAKRRLSALLIDATLATGVNDTSNPEASRHVLRAAALIVGKRDVELTDTDRVEREYAAMTAPPLPRWPVASIVTAIGVLGLTTAVGAAAVIVATSTPPHAFVRPTPPLPAGAYAVGGAPVHDPAIDKVVRELAGLVAHQPVTRDPAAFGAYAGVASAWRDLIETAPSLELDDRSRDPDELRARVQVVSDQLAAAGLGYFADVERSTKNEPVIGVYKIEKVTFVRADGERVRVLDAHRLAPAETARPVLGLKPEGMTDPVVVLEQVESHVGTQFLPVLDGVPYALADDGWGRTARGRNATAAATRAIRRELGVALGADAGSDRALDRVRKLVLASVRHHEAQHGREQEHAPTYPEVLAKLVGPLRDGHGRGNGNAVRARNELSAYTSQIASDMWLPQAALWNLARHAFQSGRRGSPESYAAVIVIEGLARQLGIPSPGDVFHSGEIDRDRLAELVAPLAGRPTIELRSAAAKLWAELFDEPLVRLVDDRFGE